MFMIATTMLLLMVRFTKSEVSGLVHSSSSVQACLQVKTSKLKTVSLNPHSRIYSGKVSSCLISSSPWKEIFLPPPPIPISPFKALTRTHLNNIIISFHLPMWMWRHLLMWMGRHGNYVGTSNLLWIHSSGVWSHLLARPPISWACLRASACSIPWASRPIPWACRLVSGAGCHSSPSPSTLPALLSKHRSVEGEESLVGLRVSRYNRRSKNATSQEDENCEVG